MSFLWNYFNQHDHFLKNCNYNFRADTRSRNFVFLMSDRRSCRMQIGEKSSRWCKIRFCTPLAARILRFPVFRLRRCGKGVDGIKAICIDYRIRNELGASGRLLFVWRQVYRLLSDFWKLLPLLVPRGKLYVRRGRTREKRERFRWADITSLPAFLERKAPFSPREA